MNDKNWNSEIRLILLLGLISISLLGVSTFVVYRSADSHIQYLKNKKTYTKEELALYTESRLKERESDWDRVENGIHVATGMKFDKNFKHIRSSCLSCHSPKLITQNRASREGWKQMIKWMQETQGLQDLGDKEEFILDYLEKNYAPENTGRRPNLDIDAIEWYVLELD